MSYKKKLAEVGIVIGNEPVPRKVGLKLEVSQDDEGMNLLV